MQPTNVDTTSLISGSVKNASSSLRNFTVELGDGRGISIEAVEADGSPSVRLSVIPASQLPSLNEAVCSVDWSWIYESVIKAVSVSPSAVRLQLDPVGPIVISVGMWQGSPFLSFQPFRPAKK